MRYLRFCGFALLVGLFVPLALFAQWEPDVRLTDDPADSLTCFCNAKGVAISGGTVQAVWHDNRHGNTEIYYKCSTDQGTTWGVDIPITNDPSWSERPSLAVSDSTVHVVWYDGRLGPPRIFYKRSLDNGTSWGSDISLTPTAGVGYHPSVAVCDPIVHVAWTDMSAGPQIYYTRSLDQGTTWEPARLITPSAPPAGKNLASIAVSGSTVHVAWMDFRSGPRIYYTRSLDSGVTWETDRMITSTDSQFPSIAVSGPTVHVVYADFRNAADAPRVYYLRSLNGGTTWEPEIELAGEPASWYPSVAASGSLVHAVWPDNRHGDVSELYGRSSADDGATWGAETRLTENPSESREPSIAVSDSRAHVIWHDNRDGNWEIYYKSAALTTPTLSATLSAIPSSGTLPFTTQITVILSNNSDYARRLAGRLDVTCANGSSFSNWRSGYCNVGPGGSYARFWNQVIPAEWSMLGNNVATLVAEDVTPSPYNEPPYPPAGDTDTAVCTVTGIAP